MPALSETEEFEFRARAEAEGGLSAAPPPKENAGIANAKPSSAEIGRQNIAAEQGEHGPVQDVMSMVGAIPQGAGAALSGIGNALEHPIDTLGRAASAIPGALKSGTQALLHPVDTAKKVGGALRTMKPETVGEGIGSTLVGGAAGKAAGVLGDLVGPSVKALQKPVSPTIRDLAAKGVVTTPGMRGGKIASAIEQRSSSIPFAGDVIKRARGKATEQWNRQELNDAIKDAGGTEIPRNRVGRDAIAHTEAEMGKAYTRVLGKMGGDLNSADSSGVSFRQFLQQTKHAASKGLDKSEAKIVDRLLGEKVLAKFDAAGKATGERVKEIQETLRTEIDQLKGGTYQERKAAEVLKQVQAEMKAMLKRENPKLAVELDNVDRGYAKFKASSKAALYSTKNEGIYTPAQKLRAIRDRDKSKDKQRFASGTAHGQKDTEAVESVIGNTEPDSGSAGRIATIDALLAGGTLIAGHPIAAMGVGAAPLVYSQPVLKMLQNRALKKGGAYTPIGRSAPIAGALMAPGTDDLGRAQ